MVPMKSGMNLVQNKKALLVKNERVFEMLFLFSPSKEFDP